MGIAILSILDLEESSEDSAVSKLIQSMNQSPAVLPPTPALRLSLSEIPISRKITPQPPKYEQEIGNERN
jgi:hypothetical protein